MSGEASLRLPGQLAEPLHMLEPSAPSTWPWIFLLLVVVLFALDRWLKKRQRSGGAETERKLEASRPGHAVDQIEELQGRAGLAPREGCHQLAGIVRTHFDEIDLRPIARMTALEVEAALGDEPRSRLLLQISEKRFGRQEPRRDDFERLCSRALRVVGQPGERG